MHQLTTLQQLEIKPELTQMQILPQIQIQIQIHPPIKEPSKIFYVSNTDITVEYDNDVNNSYQICTSYTFENNGGNIKHLVDNNNSTSWASLYNIYFLPPNYSGTNYLSENTKDTKGEWIYYKLPKQISLFKYTISSVNNRPQTWDTTSNTKLDISL